MHEFILANLLFHAAAGTALMLVAASSAARELHSRRPTRTYGAVLEGAPTVIELPGSRVPRSTHRADLETRSEAA